MGITRSHFIIDEQGNIADAQVKVSPTESVERALAALGYVVGCRWLSLSNPARLMLVPLGA